MLHIKKKRQKIPEANHSPSAQSRPSVVWHLSQANLGFSCWQQPSGGPSCVSRPAVAAPPLSAATNERHIKTQTENNVEQKRNQILCASHTFTEFSVILAGNFSPFLLLFVHFLLPDLNWQDYLFLHYMQLHSM